MKHPIDNIEWKDVEALTANEYNPNFVLTPELKLLKHSLLAQGWIQPILVTKENVIIDGFHRHLLCKNDKDVKAMTEGKVPCAVLDLSEPERRMLTVRINRAKGVHDAVRMHELVYTLYHTDKLTKKQICEGMGMTMDEVDLLLKEGVMKKLNIDKHKYTEAWGVEEVEGKDYK